MNREQANQNERHKRQRKLLRRWFDKVQKMKRNQELQAQQKVLESFARFLMDYDQLPPIEGLDSGPYELNAKIEQKAKHQRLNFASLNLKANEKLILLLISNPNLTGFDSTINNSILDHFTSTDRPSNLQIVNASSTKSIFQGGFSSVILVAHDIEEIEHAAKLMN
jgi:hypothetical protein